MKNKTKDDVRILNSAFDFTYQEQRLNSKS